MGTKVYFRSGLNWDSLPVVTVRRMVDACELQARLAGMRKQWEEAIGGEMEAVTVNLALLFDDLVALIEGEGGSDATK